MNTLPKINQLDVTTNQNKLHQGESILYQIHKKALSGYLQNGQIDQRIISMNLLKISALKVEELLILKKAFQNKSKNKLLQEEAAKILQKFKPKTKQGQFAYYFNPEKFSQEEYDLQQFEDQLKIILKSKLNTCKVFNGTYLVDPSIEDLKKKDQLKTYAKTEMTLPPSGRRNDSPMKLPVLQNHIKRQSSMIKHPIPANQKSQLSTCNKEEIIRVIDKLGNDSLITLQQVREKYRNLEQTAEQEQFFRLVKNGDVVNLNQQLLNDEIPLSVINSPNEKGFYAIHLAVMQGDAQLFNLLIKYGADQHVLTKRGKSIQQLSQIYFNDEINAIINQHDQKIYK